MRQIVGAVAASVLLAVAVGATAIMDPGEELVMHVVANAIGAAGRSVHWDNGSIPCPDWIGVHCGPSGRVVSISAQGVDLNGTLPADMHHLSKLRFLDLRRNRITGPLPQARFPELKTLLVDRNGFTSVPPNILGLMPMLATLSLSDNVELQEWELPAARAPHSQLRVLEARNASVAGTLWLFLRNGSAHPNLVRLLLANNRLAGPVMFSSTMLRYLDLSHNMLTGTIEFITGLPNVEELRLHDNAFTGVLPDFSKLWRLKVLTLSQNQFTGIVPVSLINHGGLTSVSLAENLFQGPLPEFPRSVQTDVAHAAYWGSFCRPEPGPCQERVVLLLLIAAAFQFPVSLATSWRGNDPCAGWLGVYCDNSTGEIIGVNLSHLGLNGTSSPVFGALRSLQALLLGGNNLAGEVPQSLLRLASLRVLDVSDNAALEDMPPFRSSVLILARGNPKLTAVVPRSPASRYPAPTSALIVYAALSYILFAKLATLVSLN